MSTCFVPKSKHVLILLLCSHLACAMPSIETARATIMTALQKWHPAIITEFKKFCKQYDNVTTAFFDTQNKDSLPVHITRMERELQTLQKVCDNPQYQNVKPLLLCYCRQIAELISVLKQHVGSHEALSLCFKLYKFKILLPEHIKNRGNFALFRSVHHRLHCN